MLGWLRRAFITAEVALMSDFTKKDMEGALQAISSMTSKSEKTQKKLTQGTWQHTMLSDNLKALYIASPLLSKALRISAERV